MKKHYLYTDMSLKHVFIISILSVGALLFARSAGYAQTLPHVTAVDTLLLDDGSLYMGQLKDSLFNGTGKMIYADGTIYKGEWKDGLWHGNGELHFPDGDFYQGEFSGNEFNGTGAYYYSNGASYEGHWENGRFNGAGRMKYADGSTYAGEWKDDAKEGLGVLYNATDSILTKGYFHKDQYLTSSHEIYYNISTGHADEVHLPMEKTEPNPVAFYMGVTYGTRQLLSIHFGMRQERGVFAGLLAGVSMAHDKGIGKQAFDYYLPAPEFDLETGEYFQPRREYSFYVDWDEYPNEILNEQTYPKAHIQAEAGWKWKHIALGGSAGITFNYTIRNCRGGKGSPFAESELYYREKMTGIGFAYRVFSDIIIKHFDNPEHFSDLYDVSFRIGYGCKEGLFMGLGTSF